MAHTIDTIRDIIRGMMAEGATPADIAKAVYDETDDDSRSTEGERERARSEYCAPSSDTIEVDDDALASRGEDGVWIAAWVWLQGDEIDDAEESDDE